jgi:uncharacterized protein (TIGR03435 family)
MLQALLREYFGLKVHESSRLLPSFALVQSKGGPKFKISPLQGGQQSSISPGSITVGGGQLTGHAIPISSLLDSLTGPVGRNLVDRTNLHGVYEIHLVWNPNAEFEPSSSDPRPSIFVALQEQLGLKLVPMKLETKILVVDQAASPNLN